MSKLKYKEDGLLYTVLNFRFMVLLSNFLLQGLRYMSYGEAIFKITITFFLALILIIFGAEPWVAFFVGHFLNYVFNGQFFVVYRYLGSKQVMSFNNLTEFIDLIDRYGQVFQPADVLLIGSFCRGQMRSSSDLDIRIFHENSLVPSLKAYMMAMMLRFKGLVLRFPIDVFCFSKLEFLNKIDPSEIPACFNSDSRIISRYGELKRVKVQLEKIKFDD